MLGSRLLFVSVIILVVVSVGEGLRGCSKFGHSCFGAHGKRNGEEERFENSGGLTMYNVGDGKSEDNLSRNDEQQIKEITPNGRKNTFIRKWLSTLRGGPTDSTEP